MVVYSFSFISYFYYKSTNSFDKDQHSSCSNKDTLPDLQLLAFFTPSQPKFIDYLCRSFRWSLINWWSIISAFVAVEAEKLLQKEIIRIKIKQSIELLDYIEERYNIQKQIMYSTQNYLADFKDRNVAISSSSFENKLTRLEQNYRNANTVFKKLLNKESK